MGVQHKIIKYSLFGFLSILVSIECQASESQHSALEQLNLKKALYCMDILENRPDMKSSHRIDILRNECIAETYIQHSPHVADGRDAVLSLFAKRYKKNPELSASIKRTTSEGDLVWIHQHVKKSPDDLGSAVINIFRMKDGKFVEHWNVGTPVSEKSKNSNTMF